AAVVIAALAGAHAAEVEADRRDTHLDESPCQSVDNLVVERAAVERMRVTDHTEWGPRRAGGRVLLDARRQLHERLDLPRGTGDPHALRAHSEPRRRKRRSTGRRPHDPECAPASSTSSLLRRCTNSTGLPSWPPSASSACS